MAIVNKCTEVVFSLVRKDEAENIEEVDAFNYLGRLLHRSENDWPEVLRNIRMARKVWGNLWKLL